MNVNSLISQCFDGDFRNVRPCNIYTVRIHSFSREKVCLPSAKERKTTSDIHWITISISIVNKTIKAEERKQKWEGNKTKDGGKI